MIVYKNQRFKKPVNNNKHYITNETLLPLITEYRESRKFSPEFINALMLIAKRLSTSPNFRGYDFVEDCVQDALLCCIKYIHNFDPEKSKNPFGYITEIMKFAFLGRINKEYGWGKIKSKARMYDADGFLIIDEKLIPKLNDSFDELPSEEF